MSICIAFHFKIPKPIEIFINELKHTFGFSLERDNYAESFLGNFLGFASTLFEEEEQSSYFEELEEYNNLKNFVKEYNTVIMLSSSVGQGYLKSIQEMSIFNIAFSICMIYKIHGSFLYDDGAYLGTIGYVNGNVVNLDTNSNLCFPKIIDLL